MTPVQQRHRGAPQAAVLRDAAQQHNGDEGVIN